MTNPNSNPILHDVLVEQYQKIEYYRNECVKKYNNSVENALLEPLKDRVTQNIYCPASWDGITCWPPTLAGTTSIKKCSSLSYVQGFVLENNATKYCEKDGNWFMQNNSYWTNFTECFNKTGKTTVLITHHNIVNGSNIFEEFLPLIKAIKDVGYGISLTSLVVAVLIMICIRKLHCTRNKLHINLFASFIFRALIYLIKEIFFIYGTGLRSDVSNNQNGLYFNIDTETNNWECKLVMSLWHYFLCANYSWILMEGLYLHNLIFHALFADSAGSIVGYVILGWGLPLLVVIPWVLSRIFFEDVLCWTTNTNYNLYLITEIPTLLFVIVNLVFFVRISTVLFTKLRSHLSDDHRKQYLKWAKSTLVLVPLFGVNYFIFMGLSYSKNEFIYLLWIACDGLFGSFQGFFVAVLYCFLNGEVKAEVKPFLYRILSYMANNSIIKICFPCRKKIVRSTKGRISVCTTLSYSSMYTNGMISRNIKSKENHATQNYDKNPEKKILPDSKSNSEFKNVYNKEALEMTNLVPEKIHNREEQSFILPESV